MQAQKFFIGNIFVISIVLIWYLPIANMLLFSPIDSFTISFSVNDASHDMEWGAEPP